MPSNVEHEEIPEDLAQRLQKVATPEIPMYPYYSARLLWDSFYQEWWRFLIRYRRRSPLLMAFMQEGKAAGKYFDYSALNRKVEKVEGWIDEAKKDFQTSSVSFFWKCKIKPAVERPKHWRHPKASQQTIRKQSEKSKKKESILLPELTEAAMFHLLWALFALYFDDFKNKKIKDAVVDTGITVGYSAGDATSLLQFKIGYAPPEAHCFPILESGKKNYPFMCLADYDLGFTL